MPYVFPLTTLVFQMPGKKSSRGISLDRATNASSGASELSATNSGTQVLPSMAMSGVASPTYAVRSFSWAAVHGICWTSTWIPGCSFSNDGISWDRTSPSRPIAQIRNVVLLPADAEEQPSPTPAAAIPRARRDKTWRVICSLTSRITPTEVPMRLSRWSSISLIAMVFAGCTDSRQPSEIPGGYTPNDIDGRPLPTYQAAIPGRPLTVNSAGLSLGFDGTAQLIQDVTAFDGTQSTMTFNYTYRRDGRDLIFELSPPCPINATCLAPPRGRVPSTHQVDLDFGTASTVPFVYHFQRITLAY